MARPPVTGKFDPTWEQRLDVCLWLIKKTMLCRV
jgi:hypothetical protein